MATTARPVQCLEMIQLWCQQQVSELTYVLVPSLGGTGTMNSNHKGYFWWNHGKGAPLKPVQLWLFFLNDATHATDWMDIAFNHMFHAKKRSHRLKNQGRRHPTIWNNRDGTPDREANAPSMHQNKTYFFAVARRSDEFGLVSTRRVDMSPAALNDKITMGVGDIKSTMVTKLDELIQWRGQFARCPDMNRGRKIDCPNNPKTELMSWIFVRAPTASTPVGNSYLPWSFRKQHVSGNCVPTSPYSFHSIPLWLRFCGRIQGQNLQSTEVFGLSKEIPTKKYRKCNNFACTPTWHFGT